MIDPDPDIQQLPVAGTDPQRVLELFRQRLSATTWAHQTPDTLIAPVWTGVQSVDRFVEGIRQLYLAHLALLRVLDTGGPVSGRAERYVEMAAAVRRYYTDWPVLDDECDTGMLDDPAGLAMLFGRPDVVLAEDGPKVVETNFDSAAGGQERPDDLWVIAAELFDPGVEYLTVGRPLQAMRDYFVDFVGPQSADVHWIMKDDPVARRELTPLLDYLNHDQDVVRHLIHYAGDPLPEHRAGPGDRVGYLHRACSIYTVNKDRQRFTDLLDVLVPTVRGCTVPVGLSVLSSKLFLAWLSDPEARPPELPAAQVAAIEAMVPWTRVLQVLDPPELDRIAESGEWFVLKKADSHQASEVHFGCNLEPEHWRDLILQCHDDSAPWIIQRRVVPRMYELAEYTDAGLVTRTTGLSCCPYLMGGKLRGLETWVTPGTPNLEMITRMQFVPHFLKC